MNNLFLTAIERGPLGWSVTIFSGVAFLVMFGFASAKGDFQGLIEATLLNDQSNRLRK